MGKMLCPKSELEGENSHMKRYIALLRGINVGGKNKISMSELKKGFAELGFSEITTYLNSGNVIFSSTIDDEKVLSDKIRCMIKDKFDLDIPVAIVLQEKLEELLNHAPDWWEDHNKERYNNIIFMISPLSYEEFYDKIGNPNVEYEKVYHYETVIFWSFHRKDYQKTNWWSRTASTTVKDRITIRTANTVRKIVSL